MSLNLRILASTQQKYIIKRFRRRAGVQRKQQLEMIKDYDEKLIDDINFDLEHYAHCSNNFHVTDLPPLLKVYLVTIKQLCAPDVSKIGAAHLAIQPSIMSLLIKNK